MLQFLCQVGGGVSSCQQGALGAGPNQRGQTVGEWYRGDGGLGAARLGYSTGYDDLRLHSTNKTIQTMLMKCLGSFTLVNSDLFCFFSPQRHTEFCSLMSILLLSTVSQFFSALLNVSTETEMQRGRRRLLSLL